MRSRRLGSILGLVLAFAAFSAAAGAGVFASKQEALESAFPGANTIEHHTLVLDDEQAARVEQRAQARLESRLATVYTGIRDGRVMGHAIIDVHTVRTLPEAFMVVLAPDGSVRSTEILAFYEPPEYMPPGRWLDQFDARKLDASLRLGGEIHGISGATLSSRAVTSGVRRALALYEAYRATVDARPDPAALPVGTVAAGGH